MTEPTKEEVFRYPFGVTTDEEGNDTVRVCVVIQGLKGKTLGSDASNADVDIKPEEQSLCVTVKMHDKAKGQFRWEAKKLAGTIDPSKTKWKVKKDQVVIRLIKKSPDSWATQLANTGIDMYESEETSGDSN